MGHRIDQGDIIDMLEESITLNIPVVVELKNGKIFEDKAKQIGKVDGEDGVAFRDHEFTPLHQISTCRRAVAPSGRYDQKL